MKKIFILVFVQFIFVARVANADMVSFSTNIREEFPWYSYVVLGLYLLAAVSVSLVLLGAIKHRKKKDSNINRSEKK